MDCRIFTETLRNEANFSLSKYLTKKKYYAKSFSTYVSKWGKNDPDIKKQFGFWYRYFGVFMENGKWKRLVSHPDLWTGMFLLRFLVGVTFITNKLKKQFVNPKTLTSQV